MLRRALRECIVTAGASVMLGVLFTIAADAEELNSGRIERRFGSSRVDVLEQSDARRVSNLSSLEDGRSICRTLAVVDYRLPIPAALADAHRQILAGGSVGAVLRDHGWTVVKKTLLVGDYPVPASAGRVKGLMHIEAPARLARHVYELSVTRDDDSLPYATIIELHHPDYLTPASLQAAYGNPAAPLASDRLNEINDLTQRTIH